MFRKMAEDIDFCQEILRVILEDEKLEVLEAIPQWSGTNLQGRSGMKNCIFHTPRFVSAHCLTQTRYALETAQI
jgi:hypothetical protein